MDSTQPQPKTITPTPPPAPVDRTLIVKVGGVDSVELRHGGRRIGVWVVETFDEVDGVPIDRETSCYLEPEDALTLGNALVNWARRHTQPTEGD